MSGLRPTKAIALYSESEAELWQQAEERVRTEHDAGNVREGQVVAQLAADYLGRPGPLEGLE